MTSRLGAQSLQFLRVLVASGEPLTPFEIGEKVNKGDGSRYRTHWVRVADQLVKARLIVPAGPLLVGVASRYRCTQQGRDALAA